MYNISIIKKGEDNMNKNIKFVPINKLKPKLKNKKIIIEKDNFWEVFLKCKKNKIISK